MGNKNNKFVDNTLFSNIKSSYIFQEISQNILEKKMLKIIKYNKNIQKRLNKDINNYKAYFFKNVGLNIKFISGDISKKKSYIFEKIKNNKKFLKSKINYKSEYIISLITNKNNKLNLIDMNKRINLINNYKTDCIILEFNINDMKTFDNITKYWYENLRDTNETNLIYLIGIDNNSKGIKITYNDNIKKFAASFQMNLISFNQKNNNINNFLNDIENPIFENNLIKTSKQLFKNKNDKKHHKVVFIGSSGIGAKTCLIHRIINGKYDDSLPSTNGASYLTKNVKLKNDKEVILDIWDTAGQEKFRGLNKFFYKDANCIVLGFDVTNKSSFEDIKNYWYPQVKSLSSLKLIYLVGCKIDLIEERNVSLDEAIDLAKEYNLRYFEVSNLENIGIDELVEDIAYEIIKQ